MLQVAHIVAFGLATLGCLVATWRVRRISHAETRYGLAGLLVFSAVWALGELTLFVDLPVAVTEVAYQVGLVAGLATVGAWLYFCSAYSGQRYHREPVFRRAALAVFLGISALKLTNPVHGLYFTAERAATPFPHTDIQLLELHLVATLLAYSLAAVGFYMLFQLFVESDIRTTGLAALVSLTGLPVVLNLAGFLVLPQLVASNYEPLGVAAFAIGALYLAEDTFESARWTAHQQVIDRIDEGIIIVDEDDIVREFNTAARRLFPALEAEASFDDVTAERRGQAGSEPEGAVSWDDQAEILSFEQDGETQYYVLSETALTVGPHSVGRAVVTTDVTQVERQRRELRRQAEQLDGFAAAVAHELRNTLTIADANLALIREALEQGRVDEATEMVGTVGDANDRMTEIVGDLTTLARLSQSVTDPSPLQFGQATEQAFGSVDTGDLTLRVEGDGRVRADETRVDELVKNATRLAGTLEASELVVGVRDGEIRVQVRGDSLQFDDTEGLFEYGSAVPTSEAGMCGPNIRTLARAHGWEVSAEGLRSGGIEVVIDGVTVERLATESHGDRIPE